EGEKGVYRNLEELRELEPKGQTWVVVFSLQVADRLPVDAHCVRHILAAEAALGTQDTESIEDLRLRQGSPPTSPNIVYLQHSVVSSLCSIAARDAHRAGKPKAPTLRHRLTRATRRSYAVPTRLGPKG